jgi:hypothetical protein
MEVSDVRQRRFFDPFFDAIAAVVWIVNWIASHRDRPRTKQLVRRFGRELDQIPTNLDAFGRRRPNENRQTARLF